MLSKQNRLPKRVISPVLRTGKKLFFDAFQISIFSNSLLVSRWAIVVSKKTAKLAVDRNRIKRILSEAIRHLLPTIKTGVDCVIVAKKNFSDKKAQDVEKVLRDLFQKNAVAK